MKRQLTIRRTVLAMALAALGVSGAALAVPEDESKNNNFGSPQALEIGAGGIATIDGAIGSSNDVDFYSFQATVGDEISLDIDGTTPPHDTMVYLFNPAGNVELVIWDGEPLDAGSAPYEPGADATFDPRNNIPYRLNMDGTWKIAVVSFQVVLGTNGTVTFAGGQTTGPYTLVVSGLKSTMQTVNIDIKPGNNERSVLNPNAKGAIPVMLLSNPDFNPFQVDVASLKFGRTGDEASLSRCAKDGRDVNGDGIADRLCHFDNEKADFWKSSAMGYIKGTKAGKPFQGSGDLKVVPQKRGG
jgi:hypothetical protein